MKKKSGAKYWAPKLGKFVNFATNNWANLSVPASPLVTDITKGIKFTANTISKTMDKANGGTLHHGGFHRVFGGHSIADLNNWHKFGFGYAKELSKDSLTPNGIPFPGIEHLTKNKVISQKFASNWGSANVGDMLASGASLIDTCYKAFQIYREADEHDGKQVPFAVTGSIKIITGTVTTNPILIASGSMDLIFSARAAMREAVNFDEDDEPFGFHFT